MSCLFCTGNTFSLAQPLNLAGPAIIMPVMIVPAPSLGVQVIAITYQVPGVQGVAAERRFVHRGETPPQTPRRLPNAPQYIMPGAGHAYLPPTPQCMYHIIFLCTRSHSNSIIVAPRIVELPDSDPVCPPGSPLVQNSGLGLRSGQSVVGSRSSTPILTPTLRSTVDLTKCSECPMQGCNALFLNANDLNAHIHAYHN